MTIYMVDIDGTICYTDGNKYKESKPKQARIEYLNELFDKGDEIHYWTARGAKSGIDWIEFTKEQLKGWGVKFTSVKTKNLTLRIRLGSYLTNTPHICKNGKFST